MQIQRAVSHSKAAKGRESTNYYYQRKCFEGGEEGQPASEEGRPISFSSRERRAGGFCPTLCNKS